ncbi:formyltetrahydrofolate deformylase [Balneolales bacterium ANBcel1]|nr:formyltetrahydrofolate deformylase [Balneolales bacterium ANBcel1]
MAADMEAGSTNGGRNSAIVLIHCPDKKGLVSAVTRFLAHNNGNILEIDQHVDKLKKVFFMRVEWDLNGFLIPDDDIRKEFSEQIAKPFDMSWQLFFSREKPRMAIFVSRYGHCLHDMLARYDSGEWHVEIPLIISNHADMKRVADRYGIDYHQINVAREHKRKAEEMQKKLLAEYRIDVMVLARYMQILSDDFVSDYPGRIINIHHSFLPAFPGAKPYHSAFERGVKIIGATSHYVTADLDEGPIIEQDVIHVNHRHSVEDLARKGRDLEKVVLARAIWHHLQRRTLVFENRTIVFQ